jgi:Tfp pilus assembly protein PilF
VFAFLVFRNSLVRIVSPSAASLLLILVVVFAIYAPSLSNGFAMDDRLVAMGSMDRGKTNLMVVELAPISEYFGSHYWAGTQLSGDLYRPVTVLSYAARHQMFGDWPLPAHIFNLALHLAAVVLVFWMLRRLGMKVIATAAGTATFGVHAIHSEVVANVVGRAELFAFVFGATGLALWSGSRCRTVAVRVTCMVLAACCLFLAFCSKESALAWSPFLVVFGAAVHWEEHRAAMSFRVFGRLCGEVAIVCAVPVAMFLVLRANALDGMPTAAPPVAFLLNQLSGESFGERLPTALWVWAHGVWLTALPFWLAADYSAFVFTSIESFFDVRVVGTLLVFGALLFFAARYRTRAPGLFVAAACFFGFSFITSNVPLTIGTIFGERLYYAPSLALAFVVAWAMRACVSRPKANCAMSVGAAIWCVVSMVVVLLRVGVWEDNATLFDHEVVNQLRSARMHTARASILIDRGDHAGALASFEAALGIDPDNKQALNNKAAILLNRGDPAGAERLLRRGIASTHIGGLADDFSLQVNLAVVLGRRERMQLAMAQIQRCLLQRPGHLPAFVEPLRWYAEGLVQMPQIVAMLRAVSQAGSRHRPYTEIYRGLLLHDVRHGQRAQADAVLRGAFDRLPSHEDRVEWMERIGLHLIAAEAPEAAVSWLQAALERRPYLIRIFQKFVELTADGRLAQESLRDWLSARGDGAIWRLYRALATFHRSRSRPGGGLANARSELEGVLPDLSRWRYRGDLVAECRMQLGNACRALNDEDAAKLQFQAVADDPAMPANARVAARKKLAR